MLTLALLLASSSALQLNGPAPKLRQQPAAATRAPTVLLAARPISEEEAYHSKVRQVAVPAAVLGGALIMLVASPALAAGTAAPAASASFNEVMGSAMRRALGGGISGAIAGVIQVRTSPRGQRAPARARRHAARASATPPERPPRRHVARRPHAPRACHAVRRTPLTQPLPPTPAPRC